MSKSRKTKKGASCSWKGKIILAHFNHYTMQSLTIILIKTSQTSMEQQISLARWSFVGFSKRLGGFLLGVKRTVNCNRLQDQMVRTIMQRTLLVLTFSSLKESKNSMISAAVPMYTSKSCASWSRVRSPLGSIHRPMIKMSIRNCSMMTTNVSVSTGMGMFSRSKGIPTSLRTLKSTLLFGLIALASSRMGSVTIMDKVVASLGMGWCSVSMLSFLARRVSSLSNSMSQMEGQTEDKYRKMEGQNLEY